MQHMNEIGFSNYCITKDGRVFSKNVNKFITQQMSHNGYLCVSMIGDDGVRYRKKLHRILMQTFKPLDNYDGMFVNHIDCNKTNNNLSNLEWVTSSQNMQHARDSGLLNKRFSFEYTKFPDESEQPYNPETDEMIGVRQMNEEDVHNICQLIQDGYRVCDIVKMVGVSKSVIQKLKFNKIVRFKHISSQYSLDLHNKSEMTSIEKVIEICERLPTCNNIASLSRELGVHEKVISNIKARKTFLKISSNYVW